jgi:glyoxylase-like metal-dependent hydrolase (beta-lactamase superfamily II)
LTSPLEISAPNLARAELLEEGDRAGNHGIFKLTTINRHTIFALGIPQDGPAPQGPTWVYLLEDDGWSMVDAGDTSAYKHVVAGMSKVGLEPRQVQRVFITHGHWDHDGGVPDFQRETGAEVWAHEAYEPLKAFDDWLNHGESHPLLRAGRQAAPASPDWAEGRQWSQRRREYDAARKALKVTHPIWDGRRCGDIVCWQTPGHTADELTILFDGVIFTGDHVLPEITPHPSVKTTYSPALQERLPAPYRDASTQQGLAVYLGSLARVGKLGGAATVLPAHRLLNKQKVNIVTAERAGQIMEHHLQRMNRLIQIMGVDRQMLHHLTVHLFAHRHLEGGNLFSAMTEVVAHLEFMDDCGDLLITEDGRVAWKGTWRYREKMTGMMDAARQA